MRPGLTILYISRVFILFCFWITIATGLECPKCRDITIPGALANLLSNIPGLRTPNCESGTGDGVETMTCPTPSAGSTQIYKCAYFKGTIDVNFIVTTFPLNSVVRECLLVNPSERDVCSEHRDVQEDRAVLSQVVSGLQGVGFVNFQGTRCLSTTGVGAGSKLGANISLIASSCFIFILHLFFNLI